MSKLKIYIWDLESSTYLFPLAEILLANDEVIDQYYEVVNDVKSADFIVLRQALDFYLKNNGKNKFIELKDFAKLNAKNILLFTSGDFGITVKEDFIFNLRLGGFKNRFGENTIIMCPFIEDPVVKYDIKINKLLKDESPKVGFVGHSNGSFKKIISEFLIWFKINFEIFIGKRNTDYQNFYPSSYFRNKYLKMIKSSNIIKTNFIFRKKYRAGVKTPNERANTSMEFYENINNNLYTFCMRGSGNFSVRFYETLALGKIPILVLTNCKMPFEDSIEWKKHCIIIKESEILNSNEIICNYHNSKTEGELIAIQSSNRELWSNYFTKQMFFVKLYNYLKNKRTQ